MWELNMAVMDVSLASNSFSDGIGSSMRVAS